VDDLFALIETGDEDAVRDLLERRPELAETRNEEGRSPVLHTLYTGHGDLVRTLLDVNPALDVFDTAAVGRTRGLEALLGGEPELARARASDGFTALHLAAFFGHEDAAALLLEHGADVNAVARNSELQVAPLHSAAAGGHPKLVTLLLEHGADPNARQGGGFTPLHAAAQNGDRESVEALLERGADRNAQTDERETPAELAAAAGHEEIQRLLA
jgi:ankyrin repeat protein